VPAAAALRHLGSQDMHARARGSRPPLPGRRRRCLQPAGAPRAMLPRPLLGKLGAGQAPCSQC
jgi:hypothetical protein